METQTQHVMRVVASQTRSDLDALAARRTERTGTAHHVYVDRNGTLKVYSEAYEASLSLVRA